MFWHTISLGEVIRIGIAIWDKKAVWCLLAIQENISLRIGWTHDSQQSVRTGQFVGPRNFTGQSQSIKFFCFFWIKHNTQDRTGLAPPEPGVLCFGWGPFWGRIRIQYTTSLLCLWTGFSIWCVFQISFACLMSNTEHLPLPLEVGSVLLLW